MKMKINFVSLIAVLGLLSLPAIGMEPAPAQEEISERLTLTLISKEKQEFIVPLDSALQSETIRGLLQIPNHESHSGTIKFRKINSATMQEIAQLMWAAHHQNLTGKAFLDALEKETAITNHYRFLKAADFLDLKPALGVVARSIIANPEMKEKAEALASRFGNAAPELARYYFLTTRNQLPNVPESHYGFSIQDYLDYRPKLIEAHRSTSSVSFVDLAGLDFSKAQLTSLEGLNEIPNIATIEGLGLNENQLQQIPSHTFSRLTRLQMLYLCHNKIRDLDPQTFLALTNLTVLRLPYNKIQKIQPHTFAGLNKLVELQLNGNQLKHIDSNTFHALTDLRRLALGSNQLEYIAPNTLNGLTNLEELGLLYNQFKQIDASTFSGLTNLRDLSLSGNQLTQEDQTMLETAIRAVLPHVFIF